MTLLQGGQLHLFLPTPSRRGRHGIGLDKLKPSNFYPRPRVEGDGEGGDVIDFVAFLPTPSRRGRQRRAAHFPRWRRISTHALA